MNKVFVIKSEYGFVSKCPLGTGEIVLDKEFIKDATFFDSEESAYQFMLDNSTAFIGFSYYFYKIECVVVVFPRNQYKGG